MTRACYIVLKGCIYTGHETRDVFLDKDKAIQEALHLVHEYNEEVKEAQRVLYDTFNKELRLNKLIDTKDSSSVLVFSNESDFVSVAKRKLIE